MAGKHFDELESYQQSSKIAIPLVQYDYEEFKTRKDKKKAAKKATSKFASTAYNDEDFESYKPKT